MKPLLIKQLAATKEAHVRLGAQRRSLVSGRACRVECHVSLQRPWTLQRREGSLGAGINVLCKEDTRVISCDDPELDPLLGRRSGAARVGDGLLFTGERSSLRLL
jgi:hypothetical protein